MENRRYNEIEHENIKTMDDINKIVENETKLAKQRKTAMKEGMASATVMSMTSKIIISIMFAIFAAATIFLSGILYKHFEGSFNKTKMIKEKNILTEKHGQSK